MASCGVGDSSLTGATQNEDDAQCGEEDDDDDEPHFFDPPPKEYECPICFRVLREPNIVSCCGTKVCGPCITRVENSRQPCPKCRQPFTKMLEKELQRKILGLRVHCRHYGEGCEWEGELRDMYKHIDVKKGACEFVAVKCPFGCPGSYQRREASNHESICTNLPPELHIKRTMRVTEEFKEEFQATLTQFQELCKSENAQVEELTAQCRAGAEQLESVLQSFNEKRVEVDKKVGDIIKKLQTTFFVEQQEKLQQLFEEMLSKERKEQQEKIQQLRKEHEIKLAETEHQFEDKKKKQIKDLQRECREESKKQMTTLMTSLRGEFAQEMSQLKRRCEEEHQQQMASLKEQFEKEERERSEALKKQYDAEHQKQLVDLKKYYEKELKEKYEGKVKQQMEKLEVEYYTQREKQIETLQKQYYTDKEQQLDTLKEQYAASRQRMSTEIRQLYENEHKQRMKECKEQCIKEHEKMKKEYHDESQQQLKEAKAIFGAEKDKIVEELRVSLTAEKEELKVKFKEECEEVKLEAKPVPTGVTSSDSSIAIHTSPASVSSFKNEPSPPGLWGLSNSGNTSFMNSALQCLGNTKPLAGYVGYCIPDVADPSTDPEEVEAMDTAGDSPDDQKDQTNNDTGGGARGVQVTEDGEEETVPVPNYNIQKEEIQLLLTQQLKKEDEWYLVDQKWLKQWKKHTGFDSCDQHSAGEASSNPGPVDNSNLFKDQSKDTLKDHLMEELDYALLPKPAWEKLTRWYGVESNSKPICRRVVEYGTYVKHLKVEVYLIDLKLAIHPHLNEYKQHSFSRADTIKMIHEKMREIFEVPNEDETRLWQRYMTNSHELLTNENQTVSDAGIYGGQMVVLEKKSKEGQWSRTSPSSMSSTSSYNTRSTTGSQGSSYSYSSYSSYGREPSTPGLCGLSNLGNTCFMNSALQCLGNTKPLAEYFIGKGQEKPYKKHINRDNPLGMGGVIAETYGSLLEDMWSGQNSYIAPRQFKNVIGRHAPQFSGYMQHDSHELLAFLLDGLHEDLNLVKKKPYVDMDIKTGDREDEDIAKETWHKYLLRNQSVIVRLFQGQLKSTLHCPRCKKVSRIFDPFMYLSLPLPVQNTRFVEVYLVRADPTVCVMKYRLEVPKNGVISHMKEQMQKVTNIDPSNLVVIDVYHSRFHRVYYDKDPISHIMERDDIYIYELRKPLGDQDWVPVPVYMREIKHHTSNSYFGHKQVTTYGQVFGLPVVVTVSRKGCTYRALYDTIMSQITRFVIKPEKEKKGEEEEGMTEEGSETVDSEMKETEEGTIRDEDDMEVESNTESKTESEAPENKTADPETGTDASQTETQSESEANTETESEANAESGTSQSESEANANQTETNTEDATTSESVNKDGEEAPEKPEESMDTEGNDESQDEKGKPEETEKKEYKDLFNLVIVNSYGSQEVQKLKDNDEMLKLTSQTYIGCDWELETKEECYNMKEAESYEEHDSCTATKEPKKPITVYGCMDLFVQKEVLGEEDTWYCPTCKEHVQASKKFDLWKMPEVLVIHLKRFSYSRYFRNKIESRVEFPLQDLELSKYVVNEEEPHPLYDLFAVSNHYGGLGGGHYTAYAKNKDNGKWYSFDDSHVSEVSSESICSSSSYVLFYQRKTEGGMRRPEPLNRSLSVSFDEEVKEGNKRLQKKQQSNQSDSIVEENEDKEGNDAFELD